MAEKIEPENNTIVNISNFGVNMTEGRLLKMFEKYGAISSYGIMHDDEPCRRFAYVAFEDSDAADESVIELNGQLFDDNRRLRVRRKRRNEGRIKVTSWSGKGCSIKNNDVAEAGNDVAAGPSNVTNPPANPENWSENTGFCLHIANLDRTIDDRQLRTEFEEFGPLREVKIIKEQQLRVVLSKGYAFVTFVHENDARRAIEEKNNRAIGRQIVRVSISRGKKKTSFKEPPKAFDPRRQPVNYDRAISNLLKDWCGSSRHLDDFSDLI
ncbi:polyadenylate-binding protein 4-like [Venturia canescens]|uniref:polyadenylate-binding protein 4-like n=1 Tax=Venturia canescens TaxID=32260 RepID=UPI001C9BFD88|nr:polyadenylate-binding protein 4-like [Venturia canescens]